MQEGKEGSAKKASRKGNRQDEGQFIGIGKKISMRFGRVIMICLSLIHI